MKDRTAVKAFHVGARRIGEGQPCYIVAELSGNHNQSIEKAVAMVQAAKRAGADAVKLQTYTADTLTIKSDAKWFKLEGGPWAGRTLHDLYNEAHTPWAWHETLFKAARDCGLDCFSTPFDDTAVDFLEKFGVPVHKVASFEIVDLGLLKKVGSTGKPVILSTGMASREEIKQAIDTLRAAGSGDIALLKCTSAYPAPPEEMNLRTIPDLRDAFQVVAGLSDHTLGGSVAVAAVALGGAAIVEKHFTLDRGAGGPDAAFSMEPEEFAQMVRDIRQAERALGHVSYERTREESKSLCFRRSLFVVADVKAGESFTPANVRSIRPGYGLPPAHLDDVLGKKAARDVPRGTPLAWDMVKGGDR
jgi:pseudaminic acid synthase